MHRPTNYRAAFVFSLFCLALWSSLSLGAWHDNTRPFRRPIQLEMDKAMITGEELAYVRILANGAQQADGRDVRVLTDTGKPTPFRVLNAGPGDYLYIAFNALKGVRDYDIYFGDPKAVAPADLPLNHGGLLLEMRQFSGGTAGSEKELQIVFERSRHLIGTRIVPRPFLGVNPLGGQQMSVSKFSGKLFAPLPGTYTFAVSADDRAGLFINGKPVVFCRHPIGDVRFQNTVQLERGWHDILIYHADNGGEYGLSVVWKRPDMDKFDVIGREFFGMVQTPIIGALEEQGKTLTADMNAVYQAETFFAWNYSHRYRFTGQTNIGKSERVQFKWDFGDGQSATGREIEHVYLMPDIYKVTIEAKIGGNTDSQTFRLPVDRDLSRIENPPTDELPLQAKFVAAYDLPKLAPDSLTFAVIMQMRAAFVDSAVDAAKSLAIAPKRSNSQAAVRALDDLQEELLKRKEASRMVEILSRVPRESDLNPWAASTRATLLMYGIGDFPAAIEAIKPFAQSDNRSKRTYGQALVLTGQFDKGREVLEGLAVGASKQKAPALSGAMARSTEFYVEEKNPQAGEQAWEKWMTAFPGDFLDGNAAVMRVRLIELRGNQTVAAKVAEAYANSNAQSAYAPRLLDIASRLLEKTDAAKSRNLRQLLKDRYPEDPLSQK